MSDQQPPRQIGTDDEQTVHRPPAPSPAEHTDRMREQRPGDCIGHP